MSTFTPLSPLTHVASKRQPTQIMSILNTTPDSFSDGGVNTPTNTEALTSTIKSHITAGATIIDVGGQSSRPNAPNVTAEEEIARVVPAIKIIRSLPEANHIAVSVDTYRAAVAEAAVKAGAHIVNDISAGTLDPDMLATVAQLGCTYVMMHMRGTPATMQDPENLVYNKGVRVGVYNELAERVKAAQEAGIRRWRIIIDPGIGFAKTVEHNLQCLRNRPLKGPVNLRYLPWLVGPSRKGFIGQILGIQEPKDRIWGTAATITAAIQSGAAIVRVHDVAEMAQVAKMSDAIYGQNS